MDSKNNVVINPIAFVPDPSFGKPDPSFGKPDPSFGMPDPSFGITNSDVMETSSPMEGENGNFDAQVARKPWLKRAGAAIVKIAPEVKRRRKNYQAKKLMIPKNPLMILNELKPGLPYNISEKTENNQTAFVVTVEIDGQTFTGKAPSKKLAQQDAAESALRGLFFDKLMEQLVRREDEDTPMKEEEVDGVVKSQIPQVPEDDTPWSSLASLAMFKLAAMWQGSVKPSVVSMPQNQTANPCFKGKLPPNPNEVDPVMLLYQLSPSSKFSEQERDVRNGATFFTLTVDFNGQQFNGSATKKKQAKKICAKSALRTLGIEYSE